MLEILTVLSKLDRVSRAVNPATFVAAPGIWAAVGLDGSLTNCAVATELVHKMVIGSKSSNIYEGQDVDVGRITTMESLGARCKVDSNGYDGVVAQGAPLYVSYMTTGANSIGKLVSTAQAVAHSENGQIREIVARAQEVGTGYIVFETISPYTATL